MHPNMHSQIDGLVYTKFRSQIIEELKMKKTFLKQIEIHESAICSLRAIEAFR